ncbi:GNAT family N-acetyltransferase [Rossellomorea aquimaris]|uniref:GNAT family N-acetyltransferase n=1 Tax=Rossellomorea aquimaris TaxID=189382 RepID=UPI0007D041B0|nr:GNAT family N-acetyltransferase [Rossellomorea aquimaris]
MVINPISQADCQEARDVILSGFRERFGFIDYSLNPDIYNIIEEYKGGAHHFFVGMKNERIVSTGAIRKEKDATYQIVRMSVLKEYRQQGLGRAMLLHLENEAVKLGARRLILETNKKWEDAIQFYKNYGFTYMEEDEVSCYFEKEIPL